MASAGSVIDQIRQELRDNSDQLKAEFFPKFFTSEPGETDQFLGVTVPKQRAIVARHYKQLQPTEVLDLLHSEIHEERLTALLILVKQFEKGNITKKNDIYDLYLQNTQWVNNWDLVDSSAHKIVGNFILINRDEGEDISSILDKLPKSSSVWERRIAMIATLSFIRRGDFTWTLTLAERYLSDNHHYIQKATGWMLREVGKKDVQTLLDFLDQHAPRMPRIMLRYAIEKLDKPTRTHYLQMKP